MDQEAAEKRRQKLIQNRILREKAILENEGMVYSPSSIPNEPKPIVNIPIINNPTKMVGWDGVGVKKRPLINYFSYIPYISTVFLLFFRVPYTVLIMIICELAFSLVLPFLIYCPHGNLVLEGIAALINWISELRTRFPICLLMLILYYCMFPNSLLQNDAPEL